MKKHEKVRNEWLVKTGHARPEIPGYDPEMAKRQFPRTVSVWNGFLREEFTVGAAGHSSSFPTRLLFLEKNSYGYGGHNFLIISL